MLFRSGTLKIIFEPEGGGEPIGHEVYRFKSSGCALGMYNLDDSIRGFARSCMHYALNLGWPLYLSTKNTILKQYDGRFKDLFQEVFDQEFASAFRQAGITYEHRLIDDCRMMVFTSSMLSRKAMMTRPVMSPIAAVKIGRAHV